MTPTLWDSPSWNRMEPCPFCDGSGRVPSNERTAPLARASDPDTSHKAAARHQESARFKSGTLLHRMLDAFAAGPKTALDAARYATGGEQVATVSQIEGARRRTSTLARHGMIEPTGEVHRNDRGSDATIYDVTWVGKMALASLRQFGWSIPPR